MSLHVSALRGTFPPFQTQSVEQSPTATPHHTRVGTPIHEKLLDRSGNETNETMAALNALMKPSPGKPEEIKMTRVSHIDGSADVSLATKLNFLMVYLLFNLGLTLYNKAVMIQVCANSSFRRAHEWAPCLVKSREIIRSFNILRHLEAHLRYLNEC